MGEIRIMITDFKLYDVVSTIAKNGRTVYGVVDDVDNNYGKGPYSICIDWISNTNIKCGWWYSDDIDHNYTRSKLVRVGGVRDIIDKYKSKNK